MKVTYPVIFTECETNILIEVPDLGILSEANEEGEPKASMADAMMMVRDAIGIKCISAEDNGKEAAKPSDLSAVDVSKGTFYGEGRTIISLIDVDLSVYRMRIDNKMVRRNVTLPNWLNLEADRLNLNVSKVLQDALTDRVSRLRA